MSETIDARWLIRQWVITELRTGDDPSPSTHLISSHWLQYDSYDHESQDVPYQPDAEAAELVERIWRAQPQFIRVALRPFYFERQRRGTNLQHDLATIFESRAWGAYDRGRNSENVGISHEDVCSAS